MKNCGLTSTEVDPADRLAEAVRARMEQLMLKKAEVRRRAGGLDYRTLQNVLDGQGITRADKRRSLSVALGWTEDSIDRVLRGEDPRDLVAGNALDDDRFVFYLKTLERPVVVLVNQAARLNRGILWVAEVARTAETAGRAATAVRELQAIADAHPDLRARTTAQEALAAFDRALIGFYDACERVDSELPPAFKVPHHGSEG